jgi:dienelactone hydrolase
MQALGFRRTLLHLHYPEAGHAVFVGHPEGAMARAMGAAHPAMGGTPAANLAAWQDSWPRTIEFLRTQLTGDQQ